jgi:hypothetical protein
MRHEFNLVDFCHRCGVSREVADDGRAAAVCPAAGQNVTSMSAARALKAMQRFSDRVLALSGMA